MPRFVLHARPLVAALAVALLVAGCGGGDSETGAADAPFAPQATMRATGGTQRTAKPAFEIRVTARPGDANIRSATFDLPPVVLFDANAFGGICPKAQLKADDCAGSRPVGSAEVVSPAYDEPLSGPVYAVSGFGGLPRLAYVLGGPVDLLLYGRVVSKGGRIQAGIEDVPDTPLKTFELTLNGGKPGYLVLSRDICRGEPAADAVFTSQDDQVVKQQVPLEADCG